MFTTQLLISTVFRINLVDCITAVTKQLTLSLSHKNCLHG